MVNGQNRVSFHKLCTPIFHPYFSNNVMKITCIWLTYLSPRSIYTALIRNPSNQLPQAPYDTTGQVVTCDLERGLICSSINNDGRACLDYKVAIGCVKDLPRCREFFFLFCRLIDIKIFKRPLFNSNKSLSMLKSLIADLLPAGICNWTREL